MRLTLCTVCVWCTHAAHKPCTHAHARARRFFVLWRAADGGDAYLAYYVDLTASSPRGVTRLQDCRLQAAVHAAIK